ncbi:MAG: hypothetical protein R3258_04060 [Acidimicrobiia bacterium]|nr:hypothetical protein [Acidimicrobiia bacterium]
MSHLRPEDMTERRRRAACRRGRHSYGADQHIGAGIIRRVCDACNSVNIDLTEVELTAPVIQTGDNILKLAADRR